MENKMMRITGKPVVLQIGDATYTLASLEQQSNTLVEFNCSEPNSTTQFTRHIALLVVDKEQHDLLIRNAWEGDKETLKAFIVCSRLSLEHDKLNLTHLGLTPTVFAFKDKVYAPHVRLLTDDESKNMSDVYMNKHCPNGWITYHREQLV